MTLRAPASSVVVLRRLRVDLGIPCTGRRPAASVMRAPAPPAPGRTRDTRATSGVDGRRRAPDALGQREPGGEVDDVVLAQVHEREPERAGVRPADGAGDRAGLGQQVGGGHGGGEVQGRHGGERDCLPADRTASPAGTPELLAVLDHHPPQLRRQPVVHQARPRRVPGRRRRDGPVADQRRGRTSRRCAPRRAGTAPGGAAAGRATVPCGNRNQSQCDHTSSFSQRRNRRRGRAPLEPERRRLAGAEEAVDAHRVGDPHAPLERLGVVVGHLVGRDVGPHLKHAGRPRRARACAGGGRRARTGAAAAVAVTTGGGSLRRRRTSGAATPAASAVTVGHGSRSSCARGRDHGAGRARSTGSRQARSRAAGTDRAGAPARSRLRRGQSDAPAPWPPPSPISRP